MKEMIQLSLTIEEADILRAITTVGVMLHFEDIKRMVVAVKVMDAVMEKWPEANKSLAIKMIALTEECIKVLS